MLVHAVVAAREVSTFIHSIGRPLRVMEVWSQVANGTMATGVAKLASRIDFQLEHSAK